MIPFANIVNPEFFVSSLQEFLVSVKADYQVEASVCVLEEAEQAAFGAANVQIGQAVVFWRGFLIGNHSVVCKELARI